jgi:1-acyl-sn-glycerol-3-phosphate acyltransferase
MARQLHNAVLPRRTMAARLLALPRSLAWAAGALAATLGFGTIGLAVALFLRPHYRYHLFVRWSFFIIWWARVTCGIRWVVEGEDHIPRQPCIIMCKHQSAWETLAMQFWFTPQTWVLKKELTRIPFIGWALSLLSPIAIDRSARKRAMEQMLEQGMQRLQDGYWVIVFPEGTRVPAGTTGRYQRGGAVLASEANRPILPIAHNAGEFWPRNSFLKYPGTVHVRMGPVIEPAGRDPELVLAEVKAWIEVNTRAISEADRS